MKQNSVGDDYWIILQTSLEKQFESENFFKSENRGMGMRGEGKKGGRCRMRRGWGCWESRSHVHTLTVGSACLASLVTVSVASPPSLLLAILVTCFWCSLC